MEKIRRFFATYKKVAAILMVVVIGGSVVTVVLAKSTSSQAASAPTAAILKQSSLQQIVSATKVLQSANSSKVNSTITYTVAEVLSKMSDTVQRGQAVVTLDLSDLEKTIADTRKSIANAEVKDKLAVSQAEGRLQDAMNAKSTNGEKNDAVVQEVNTAMSAAQAKVDIAKIAFDVTHGDVALEAPLKVARDKRDAAIEAYDKVVEMVDIAKRNDNLAVENAQDRVNEARASKSAQSLQAELAEYLGQRREAILCCLQQAYQYS